MVQPTGRLKRKRARVACEPCRERKRKCDGGTPCDTCGDWGYECYYAASPSSRRRALASSAQPSLNDNDAPPSGSRGGVPSTEHCRSIDPQRVARSITANSSAVFVRKMGLKIDPANAPRVNLFGWNVGARQLSLGPVMATDLPIVDIIAMGHMTQLAQVYFSKVDPCYGFIDKQAFFERLDARWQSNGGSNIYDSVLAGVAALGLLFSERTASITEVHLVQAARSILESYDGCTVPSLDLVTGWLLRVIYMRMTAAPYSTWLASSTLMHLIEAAGFHHEAPHGMVLSNAKCDSDIRRRLVGVAQHQNMWLSYDIGLSRVSLKTDLSLTLSSRPDNYTAELLGLLPISASLDPEEALDDCDLQRALLQTLDRVHTQPPSILAQTNLVLCILRRLNLLSINTSPTIPDRILDLFQKALRSAHSMLTDCCPWQHVANVPFHIVTILLEMDTCASLARLPEAMETLKLVASTYNTATMREAYATARFLVFVYQQRRLRDSRLLGNVLDADAQPEPGSTGSETQVPRFSSNLEEMPLLEELVADMPSLQKFDFDQFLNTDMLQSAQTWM
ncbi:hypothetical protein BDW62DRAFT_153553 [Aspergillus aurantiobrunneus]